LVSVSDSFAALRGYSAKRKNLGGVAGTQGTKEVRVKVQG
jgi:hypothetical protein